MELFGTAGIRGPVVDAVSPERALVVGRAAALDADGGAFVLGWDGRTTSPGLAAAVEAGLESGGASVRRIGVIPTPALAYASQRRRGIMITASHNPPADNGIKLFVDGSEYDSEAEARVESLVEDDPTPVPWNQWGQRVDEEILDRYREAVVEYVSDSFGLAEGLRVVVDCGNGMGGLATPQVLQALGATPVALNANVDGSFPARESKPTPASLEEFCSFVAADDASLGIAHDGDADRIVIVDADGGIVHEDTVVAILAERYVRDSVAPDPVVVTTPNASARIDERVRAAGGRTERVALGALHEGIARERDRGDDETEVAFAAEPWKHLHPAFGGWIDGVASAATLAALVSEAGGLDSLREPVTERPYRKESVPCPDEAKPAVMEQLSIALPNRFDPVVVDTEYGIRIELPDASWVLVRPSGTEPYVRIYAESDDVDEVVSIAREAVETAVDSET